MSFGLPYIGSKNSIAKKVVAALPEGDTLADLFAGGCAITHCALLCGKWERIIANDRTDMPEVFKAATEGKFHNETRWISREEFFALKDTDPYAALCFSFGNNRRNYCYSPKIEPYKRALHYAVVFDDWAEMKHLCPEVSDYAEKALSSVRDRKARRIEIGRAIVRRLSELGDLSVLRGNPLYGQVRLREGGTVANNLESLERLESLQNLESLESLERLQSLESLERLERLERLQSLESLERLESPRLSVTRLDYREVEIPQGAVVYADPPYNCNVAKNPYGKFDFEAFYDWARTRPFPVYISEFSLPSDFVEIAAWPRTNKASAKGSAPCTERLFLHEKWIDNIKQQ